MHIIINFCEPLQEVCFGMRTRKCLSVLLLCCLFFSIVSSANAASCPDTIVATTDKGIRTGPGASFPLCGTMYANTSAAVLGISGSWYQVSYEGITGYITKNYTRSDSNGATLSVGSYVTVSRTVNVRTGPNASFSRIGTLRGGSEVEKLGTSGVWTKVKFNGLVGYIPTMYVIESTPSSVPSVSEPSDDTASSSPSSAPTVTATPTQGNTYPTVTTSSSPTPEPTPTPTPAPTAAPTSTPAPATYRVACWFYDMTNVKQVGTIRVQMVEEGTSISISPPTLLGYDYVYTAFNGVRVACTFATITRNTNVVWYVQPNAATSQGQFIESYAEQLIEYVNDARSDNGLSTLKYSSALEEAAKVRAKEIVQNFSHTRPDGSDFWTVDERYVYGENLAKGTNLTPLGAHNGLMNSSSHKANILNTRYKSIGVACFYQNGIYYYVQLFGKS